MRVASGTGLGYRVGMNRGFIEILYVLPLCRRYTVCA